MDYLENDMMNLFEPPELDGVQTPTAYTYTFDKQIKTVTRAGESATEFIYSDVTDKLHRIAYADGNLVRYVYDEISDASQWGDELELTGQLMGIESTTGASVSFAYIGDLLHRETYVIGDTFGTHEVQNDYYNNFRPQAQSVDGAQSVGFVYGDHGLLSQVGALSLEANGGRDAVTGQIQGTSIAADGGTVLSTVQYSADYLEFAGETFNHNVVGNLYDVAYTRDAIGRIATKTETIDGVETLEEYTYDDGGRLSDVARTVTDANGASSNTVLYDYDAQGNRLTRDEDGDVWAGVYDAQDRLIQYCQAVLPYVADDP